MEVAEAVAGYESMSEPDRKQFRASTGLPSPTPGVSDTLWIIVIVIVGLVALGGGFLAFLLLNDEKDAEALVGLASAALGGLVGLFVPSPASES